MADLWAEGRGIDLALAVLALEGVLLVLLVRRRRPRASAALWCWNLLAGACLLLALRLALTGAAAAWIAAMLAGAGLAHLADLRERVGASGR